jgi:hypothetical protein
MKCRELGGRGGIPHLSAVREFLETHDRQDIARALG